ncbi:hypothetical protein CEP53_007818 [Fusarium sp. AF-6]|nr:hypothetical protein CEP53_007818 [Fusarium sp. AF-6]
MENTLTRSQSLKPPRRKLQKSDPRLKSKRGSTESGHSLDGSLYSPSHRRVSNGAPDLSDAKWNHYLRPETVVDPWFSEPEMPPEPRGFFREPRVSRASSQRQRQIPEFSHLTIQDPERRPSLDNSSISSPASSASTTSTRRRQAKTPVFKIGQLEQHALARKGLDVPEKTTSVDLIADQYRELLESRDGHSEHSFGYSSFDNHSFDHHFEEPALMPHDTLQVPRCDPWRLSPSSSRTNSPAPIAPLRQSKLRTPSAATRDTNLAAFEGDTIYFKPYSFSPPPSPDQTGAYRSATPSGHSFQENVSLQIALDLLTRELSSVVAGRPQHNGRDTAALQVWVMIEAYERLRDQVTRIESPNGRCEKVGAMFDCWLAALYSIHSSLTGGTLPNPQEYAGLEEEVD